MSKVQQLIDKVNEHKSPCGKQACLDLECQAEVMAVARIFTLVSQGSWDDARAKAFYGQFIEGLTRFVNDPQYALEGPDFMFEASWEYAEACPPTGPCMDRHIQTHVQIEKPVLEAPAKVVRRKSTKKHAPRISDGVTHPVIVTKKEQPVTTSDLTITPEILQATIERMVEKRLQEILDAKDAKVAQEATPNVPREAAGVVLAGFGVVSGNNDLSIPALDLGDVSLDTLVSAKERSPYNKARFRLEGTAPLDKDTTTYRVLSIEHARLAQLSASKASPNIAVIVPTHDAAKVAAVMTVLGKTEAEAIALLDSVSK